jgi:hypothetical protein
VPKIRAGSCQACSQVTRQRRAIIHKLYVKGYKLLRVISGLLTHTTARVRQGSKLSREFTVSQGVEQGGTLSPILFNVYVDDLLADTWQHCDGVPREAGLTHDGFAGVAGSATGLPAIVDRAFAHYHACRMKTSTPAARRAAPLETRWGGPNGCHPLPFLQMGRPIERAKPKPVARLVSLPAAPPWCIHQPRAPGQHCPALHYDRVGCAGVWQPNRSEMSRVDSLKADLPKACFHCPATICLSKILLELGLWPMSLWTRGCLNFGTVSGQCLRAGSSNRWFCGAGAGTQAAGRRRGPRQHTWLDHVGEALQECVGHRPLAHRAHGQPPVQAPPPQDPPCRLGTPPRGGAGPRGPPSMHTCPALQRSLCSLPPKHISAGPCMQLGEGGGRSV